MRVFCLIWLNFSFFCVWLQFCTLLCIAAYFPGSLNYIKFCMHMYKNLSWKCRDFLKCARIDVETWDICSFKDWFIRRNVNADKQKFVLSIELVLFSLLKVSWTCMVTIFILSWKLALFYYFCSLKRRLRQTPTQFAQKWENK